MDSSGAGDVDELLQTAAEKVLGDGIYKKYDKTVVTALIEVTGDCMATTSKEVSRLLPIEHLQSGMVIPQDLFLSDGRMLLAQSTLLDEAMVRAIQKLGKLKMVPDSIAVMH
jgi:hypothetical protein